MYPTYHATMSKAGEGGLFRQNWKHRVFKLASNVLAYSRDGKEELGDLALDGASCEYHEDYDDDGINGACGQPPLSPPHCNCPQTTPSYSSRRAKSVCTSSVRAPKRRPSCGTERSRSRCRSSHTHTARMHLAHRWSERELLSPRLYLFDGPDPNPNPTPSLSPSLSPTDSVVWLCVCVVRCSRCTRSMQIPESVSPNYPLDIEMELKRPLSVVCADQCKQRGLEAGEV